RGVRIGDRGLDARVGEDRGVELRGVFGLFVEPEERMNLAGHLRVLLFVMCQAKSLAILSMHCSSPSFDISCMKALVVVSSTMRMSVLLPFAVSVTTVATSRGKSGGMPIAAGSMRLPSA